MKTREIQTALKAAGFDPGPIDGIPGRRTVLAVKAFQASRHLQVDGVVGPLTAAALGVPEDPRALLPDAMPWLDEAWRLLGTREDPGAGSDESITGWAKALNLDYGGDEVAWCGLFVAHCVGSQLPDEPLPANPLLARSWLKLGARCAPQVGAVLVFWRGSKTGWTGHVGLYWAEDEEAFHVLGGNQGDAVSITRLAKDRLLEARWPSTAPPGGGRTRRADKNGKLSSNEA